MPSKPIQTRADAQQYLAAVGTMVRAGRLATKLVTNAARILRVHKYRWSGRCGDDAHRQEDAVATGLGTSVNTGNFDPMALTAKLDDVNN